MIFKNLGKKALILIVSEVLFVGLLSYGVNQYVFSFMQYWTWWQYLLLVVALFVLAIVSLLIWQGISNIKRKGRNRKLENQVSELQLSVMQEFFRINMEQAYGNNWVVQVKNVVENKFVTNDPYKCNYQGVYNVLKKEGVETLDEKDMDITCLTALMLHDFFNMCKVGTNFKQQIRNIQEDKNHLVSHISNHKDILNVKILELTAIKNIRSFLTYLQNSTWSYPKKQEFVDKYQEKVETITAGIFKEVAGDDKKTVEFESTRRNYLARLISEQAENSLEYIPLSYKVDDGTAMRFNLEELFTLPNNNRGFVIFSKEAGYGKTWSIQELAGQCANRALKEESENIPTPILIRVGELAVSEEPIIQAVQEILFPSSDSVEIAKEFIRENQVILFIDGMDEADIDNKEPIRRELRRLLTNVGGVTLIGGTREGDRQLYPEELPQYSICDLSDAQVKAFIDKLILDEEQNKSASYDYFENPQTSFLKSLRSPFYLKCFIDFVKEGQKAPLSDTDMMNRCIDKMIEREINKGFKVTVQIVNEFLAKLSELIGNERNCVIEQEALESIEKSLIYDKTEYASVAKIKDTLVELQILREVVPDRSAALLGFWHAKYKSLFSPVALNLDLWEW